MQARKSTLESGDRAQGLPALSGDDPRQLHALDAARPTVPQPRSERLAGPFRVKASYLERRAWPYNGQS